MALVPCRECGKAISEQAETCPSCGIKHPSQAAAKAAEPSGRGKVLKYIFVAIFGFIVFRACSITQAPPPPPKTPEEIAADAQKTTRFKTVALYMAAIKKDLRDPDSVQWEGAWASTSAEIVCIEYRARNGFGGMNREFLTIADGKTSRKAEAWNKHCTGNLHDMSYAKNALK